MSRRLVIGSRGSDLALWQARFVQAVLAEHGQTEIDIEVIQTSGDRIDDLSFDQMEGKGFFTKEIEDALISGAIDLAVHSLKDLMTTQPVGLTLGAVGFRADRRELLLIRPEAKIDEGVLPIRNRAIIGTSSARRMCQIAALNPSLEIDELRGNVPTRIRKLRDGRYDAILIAAAGVDRLKLDLSDLITVRLDDQQFLPAPAQGILGVQIREDDSRVAAVVGKLDSPRCRLEAHLERGLLARFDSGCSLPLGVRSSVNGTSYHLSAVLGERDHDHWVGLHRAETHGSDPDEMIDFIQRQLQKEETLCA